MPLEISIFSDVICPWCYVGKRRLDRALDQLGLRERAAITWLPFQLNPDMPPEGMERARYRAQKFGAERAAMFDRRLTDLGAQEGIPFAFENIERTPNTARAHVLMLQAAEQGKADSLAEALFQAYFERGRDIGDPAVLADIANAVELGPDAVAAGESDALRQSVAASQQRAAQSRVTGVPFFIVNGSWAVSGAQDTQQWIAGLGSFATSDSKSA